MICIYIYIYLEIYIYISIYKCVRNHVVDFICDKHPTAPLFSGSICIGWFFQVQFAPLYIHIFMVFFCDDRNPSQICDGLRSSQNPTSQIYKVGSNSFFGQPFTRFCMSCFSLYMFLIAWVASIANCRDDCVHAVYIYHLFMVNFYR